MTAKGKGRREHPPRKAAVGPLHCLCQNRLVRSPCSAHGLRLSSFAAATATVRVRTRRRRSCKSS